MGRAHGAQPDVGVSRRERRGQMRVDTRLEREDEARRPVPDASLRFVSGAPLGDDVRALEESAPGRFVGAYRERAARERERQRPRLGKARACHASNRGRR